METPSQQCANIVVENHDVGYQATRILGEILGWDVCVDPASTTTVGTCRPGSIFEALEQEYADYQLGLTDALQPSRNLNSALRRLVELSTTRFQPPKYGDPDASATFHHDVISQVFNQLVHHPEMARRAAIVRESAGIAEKQMEDHYARLVVNQLSRVQRVDCSDRLIGLRRVFKSFPYFRNYELLIESELAGLSNIGGIAKSTAFCGAGPLPLSGILTHVLTGNDLELIEIDSHAARLASMLIMHLERLGLVEIGAILVTEADACLVDLGGHDLIMVASLISDHVLAEISYRNAELESDKRTSVLAARSASELVSLFCYEPLSMDSLTTTGWQHVGAVVPNRTLRGGLYPDLGVSSPMSGAILAIADSSVLNSTEFFRSTTSEVYDAIQL